RHVPGLKRHAADEVKTILRDVVVAGLGQRTAHCRAIGGSRVAEQGGRGDLFVPGRFARHGEESVLDVDSQYTILNRFGKPSWTALHVEDRPSPGQSCETAGQP